MIILQHPSYRMILTQSYINKQCKKYERISLQFASLFEFYVNIGHSSYQQIRMQNKDFWGHKTQGKNYDAFRPTYPAQFIQKILKQTENPSKGIYLDVAAGTGQLLFTLYQKFDKSFGADISTQMVHVAMKKAQEINKTTPNKVRILQSDCLRIHQHLNGEKFKLVTVGQALHWFNVEDFIEYTKNVLLQENGTFAVLGYIPVKCEFLDLPEAERQEADKIYWKYYSVVKPYFKYHTADLQEYYVDPKYTFHKHFKHVDKKLVSIKTDSNIDEFINYFKTFSAYNLHFKETGVDVAAQMEEELKSKKSDIRLWHQYVLILCK